MHYLPNTDEQDAAAERCWPDNFKKVIRDEIGRAIRLKLQEQRLRHIYERQYKDKYTGAGQFANKIVEIVTVGAESGADNGFEMIFKAFMTESPLPGIARYAVYLWPYVFSRKIIDKIQNAVASDYRNDETFKYAYNVGYQKEFLHFDEFIDQIARTMIASVINGTDDMLARIYSAFLNCQPLPPARRNPKRLKVY